MSWHLFVLAEEHSVSRRLWPSRDATTRTPTRAWKGVVFYVLYAYTACCLAVLDVVLHTSYGTLPFWCLSLATHGQGFFFLLVPPYLARACCPVCDLRPGSCRVGSPCVPPVFGHKNTARFFFLVCGCGLPRTPPHLPLLGRGWMECSAVVPRLRRGVHVDALFVVCVSQPLV